MKITPGHDQFGWNYTNSQTIKIAPGIYYVNKQLNVGNNASITGNGVTLTSNDNYATNIGNNATITLTAMATGPTAGLAIAATRDNTNTQSFSNNTWLTINNLYFPSGTAYFSNNARN